MKIVALEIEEDGRVYRYNGLLQLETQWEDVGEKKSVGAVKSTTDVVGSDLVTGHSSLVTAVCECGHLEWEHIPACLYIPQGCGCGGYKEKA